MESFRTRAKRSFQKGGFFLVFRKLAEVSLRNTRNWIIDSYFRVIPSLRFVFQEKTYSYLRRTYNNTTHNERTVEVPLVMEVIRENEGKRILEVGNVLRNYYPGLTHDVLDKYELGKGIINKDAVDWRPEEPYELIVSISTMEHIGWDEEPRTPEKIVQAFKNITDNCLAPGGKLVFTIPLGYNSYLDGCLADGILKFTHQYFLKRVSADNQWQEMDWTQVKGAAYGSPLPNANAILFGVQEKG